MVNEKTPSEEYNLPIIGKVFVKIIGTFNNKQFSTPIDEYDVIKIIENDNGTKTYICNYWNSPGVVQLVPDICVIRYEEK